MTRLALSNRVDRKYARANEETTALHRKHMQYPSVSATAHGIHHANMLVNFGSQTSQTATSVKIVLYVTEAVPR